MDRRGFLQRMAAAAAAFTAAAGGSGLARAATPPAAADLPKSKRPVSITVDTSKFEAAVGEAGKQVIALLRRCRCTDHSDVATLDGPIQFTAVFREATPDAPLTESDRVAWQMIERGHLKTVDVATEVDMIDAIHLGRGCRKFEVPKTIVTATWVVPNK